MYLIETLSKLRSQAQWRVLKVLAEQCDVTKFNDIALLANLDSPNVSHALNKLVSQKLVKKKAKGSYEINYKTPLCFAYAREKQDLTLISLLGMRNNRLEPEPSVAKKLLETEGYYVKEVVVITTSEAVNDWGSALKDFNIRIINSNDATNISKIEEFASKLVEKYIRDEVVVMDLTSLTKPATIAFYNTAIKYLVPLIYVYEITKELYWIQGKEQIRKIIESTIKV